MLALHNATEAIERARVAMLEGQAALARSELSEARAAIARADTRLAPHAAPPA